jgi:hypothetical protein
VACSLVSSSQINVNAIKNTSANSSLIVISNLTAAGNLLSVGVISITSTASISARANSQQLGRVALSAFNTVVTVAGRIRTNPVDCISTTIMSVTAGKVKLAQTWTNPTDLTGVVVDRTANYVLLNNRYASMPGGQDNDGFNVPGLAWNFAFWAQPYDSLGGTIFSSAGQVFNKENVFTVELTTTTLTLSQNYSAGTTGAFSVSWNISHSALSYHHYYITTRRNSNGPGGYNVDVTLYVDGQANATVYDVSLAGTDMIPTGPLRVGIRYDDGNRFRGKILQLWIGEANYTIGVNNSTNTNLINHYNSGYVALPTNGQYLTTDNRINYPTFYAGFDYPFTDDNIASGAYYPDQPSRPVQGVFTLTASGDNIRYADATLASAITVSARAGYKKLSSLTVNSAATLTVTPYDFTKATVAMSSAFTTTNVSNRIKNVSATLNSAFTVNFDADETNKGAATLASAFTIVADSTTAQLGRAQVDSNFTLTATPYNFTKAQASIQASASLSADGRYQARTKADATLVVVSTFSATALRYRPGTVNLNSIFTVTLAPGNALRSGNITMSAFDTVLTAGKIIEFLAENTVIVTEEQRLLRVALESTVLLVQMANGVNTVTAETTDITVPQEQGRLLAQYNMPTN